jgi:hypothetical protein
MTVRLCSRGYATASHNHSYERCGSPPVRMQSPSRASVRPHRDRHASQMDDQRDGRRLNLQPCHATADSRANGANASCSHVSVANASHHITYCHVAEANASGANASHHFTGCHANEVNTGHNGVFSGCSTSTGPAPDLPCRGWRAEGETPEEEETCMKKQGEITP